MSKAVLIFPYNMSESKLKLTLVLVHAEHKVFLTFGSVQILDNLLIFQSLFLLLLEEPLIRIWQVLITFEEATTREFVNFGFWRLTVIQIGFLLVSRVFKNLVGTQMIRQLSQSIVIACPETSLDQVTLFVGVLVKQLSQVR